MNRKKCYFVYFKNFHFKRKIASEIGHYVAVTSHTLVWAHHRAVTRYVKTKIISVLIMYPIILAVIASLLYKNCCKAEVIYVRKHQALYNIVTILPFRHSTCEKQ